MPHSKVSTSLSLQATAAARQHQIRQLNKGNIHSPSTGELSPVVQGKMPLD